MEISYAIQFDRREIKRGTKKDGGMKSHNIRQNKSHNIRQNKWNSKKEISTIENKKDE